MGIFTRFRDIIGSNINSMLDEAKKAQRQRDEAADRRRFWSEKADLAVSKGRDDLAREALVEKRRCEERAETLDRELRDHRSLSDQYQDDIRQLEEKLKSAREKQRLLVQRHIHAERKRRSQQEIRRVDSAEALFKFDELESRIERMEAEAELVNFGRMHDLEDQFNRLSVDEDIERELEALKARRSDTDQPA